MYQSLLFSNMVQVTIQIEIKCTAYSNIYQVETSVYAHVNWLLLKNQRLRDTQLIVFNTLHCSAVYLPPNPKIYN